MLCINLIQKQVIIDFNLLQLIFTRSQCRDGAERSSAQLNHPEIRGGKPMVSHKEKCSWISQAA